jgi:hypothetical protein
MTIMIIFTKDHTMQCCLGLKGLVVVVVVIQCNVAPKLNSTNMYLIALN